MDTGAGSSLLNTVLGQEHAKRVIRRVLAEEKPANAYLFCGYEGLGKRVTARAFGAALLCSNRSQNGDPCGTCQSCIWMANGVHPDFKWVEPAKESTGVKIEQIRKVIRDTAVASYAGGWRIIVVDNADRMTESASNAILKILEEPPDRLVFILIASSVDGVLPTVLSRCQLLPFRPVDPVIIENYLVKQGFERDLAGRAALLSEGNPSIALEMVSDNAIEEGYSIVKGFFIRILEGSADPFTLADEMQGWEDRSSSHFKQMDLLLLYCRDLLVELIGGERGLMLLNESSSATTVRHLRPETLYMLLKELGSTQSLLNEKASKRLLYQVIAFRLKECLTRGA